MASTVFLALQANEDTRLIIEAIMEDNPQAELHEYPAMVKIDSAGPLTIRRVSVEEKIGRDWDLQELHLNLISLSGHIDETEDEMILAWAE
jgi:phenol hydroxylase P2 protein